METKQRKLRGFRTAASVAEEMGLTVRTLIRRYKTGRFPKPTKDGRVWFFKEEDIERYYEARLKG